MANVRDAAEEIEGMIREWMDANDLDETLEGLHHIPRGVQQALRHLADRLREDTNLVERIPDAVDEAATRMSGIADELQEQITFGVQRT